MPQSILLWARLLSHPAAHLALFLVHLHHPSVGMWYALALLGDLVHLRERWQRQER